jgi:hypothetical protein
MKRVAVSTLLAGQVLIIDGQQLTITTLYDVAGKRAVEYEGGTEPLVLEYHDGVDVVATDALQDVWG